MTVRNLGYAVRFLIEQMPIAEQTALLEWLTALRPTLVPRATVETRAVAALFDEIETWRTTEILARFSGVPSKKIYNALGYLTRRTAIRREGHGRYRRAAAAQAQSDTI